MNNKEIHKKFSLFGLFMTIIGILIIVELVMVVPTLFLGGLGMIIRWLIAIASLVLMIIGLVQLKISNKDLQSKELNLFFYFELIAITANTTIIIITDVLYGSIFVSLFNAIQSGGGMTEFWEIISGSFILSVIGWTILIIEIIAWTKFVAFFDDEPSFLSEVDSYKARDSAQKLKIASILNVLSFLAFFSAIFR